MAEGTSGAGRGPAPLWSEWGSGELRSWGCCRLTTCKTTGIHPQVIYGLPTCIYLKIDVFSIKCGTRFGFTFEEYWKGNCLHRIDHYETMLFTAENFPKMSFMYKNKAIRVRALISLTSQRPSCGLRCGPSWIWSRTWRSCCLMEWKQEMEGTGSPERSKATKNNN